MAVLDDLVPACSVYVDGVGGTGHQVLGDYGGSLFLALREGEG